jgi:hypothetical protein
MKLTGPILALLVLVPLSAGAQAEDPYALRKRGVELAARKDYPGAEVLLRQSAEAGLFYAQLELAYLLESSPSPVAKPLESYAWYALALHRGATGDDKGFAEEGQRRLREALSPAELTDAEGQARALIGRLGDRSFP